MRILIAVLATVLVLPSLVTAQEVSAPKVKVLAAPEDPRQKTILVGRTESAGMIIQFEIEPATAMVMPMGTPSRFVEHAPMPGEAYHLEVKPIDLRSKTRVAYAQVTYVATHRDSGRILKGELHAMWGGSGLHYAANSALAGDGRYDVVFTVHPPTFARSAKDKDLFVAPASARFHFTLKGGALIEVSEPVPLPG